MSLAILADIGGTNTRVALAEGARVLTDTTRRYANADYRAQGEDIAAILSAYLTEVGARVDGVCVAAAGPVQNDVAEMTNLSWVIDKAKLVRATGAEHVAILNDLQAQGQALGHIAAENLREIVTGEALSGGPMLVLGLGTGVNAAPVHGHGAARVVPASETGHMSMPVRNEEQLRLMHFIEALLKSRGEVAHCGVEEVLAGRGLGNLYEFAASEAGQPGGKASAEVLRGLETGDPVAEHAAALYTQILAQLLGDLALTHLPWGGIYLIGGMSRALTPHFARFGLTQHFREPRRVDLLTHAFPVTVVEDDYAALTGCAAWLEALRQG